MEYDSKYERKVNKKETQNREDDARMKYGKNFKDYMSGKEKPLRKGEVKKWDPNLKRFVSNKD
jgi:hypothetical protein